MRKSASSVANASLLTALDTLRAVLARLGTVRDQAQLYSAAVNEAAAFFKVTQCALVLIDAETGSPYLQHPVIGLNAAQEEALRVMGGDRLVQVRDQWPASGVIRLRDPEHHTLFDANLSPMLGERDVLLANIGADGRSLGVLRLANRADGADFKPEDVHLLGLFAGQLAMLINGLFLLDQEQRARRLAETLIKVPQVVHPLPSLLHAAQPSPIAAGVLLSQLGDADLRPIFTRLLRLLSQVVNCRVSMVAWHEGDQWQVIAGHGRLVDLDRIIGRTWNSSGDPMLAAMVASGGPLRFDEVRDIRGWCQLLDWKTIQSWISAPIWAPGSLRRHQGTDLIGVLGIGSDLEGQAAADLAVIQAFADQMAIMLENQRLYAGMAEAALENARLFQQTQLHLQQAEQRSLGLALLNQVTSAINSALSLYEVLNLILEQMRRFMPFDWGTIALLEGNDLCVAGASGFPKGASVLGTRYPYDGYPSNRSVIEQQQLVAIADVQHDPRWIMAPGQVQTGAWMGVPLVHHGKTIGILNLTSWQPRSYSVEDKQLVVAIAEQAALAIERARLLEEMQGHVQHAEQHSQELAQLNRISTRLSASLDVNDVMKIMVRELADALHAAQVGLMLLDWPSGRGRLVAEYQEQPDGSGEDASIPMAGNLSLARILETKAPLSIQDAQHDPLLANAHDLMVQRGVKSILLLPLIVRDQLIGTIGVDELNEMRDFSPAEIELAQTITNQAAAAITNAQLYDDIRRRAAQLQAIQEVTSRISSVLNPDELVFEVAELLAERFGYYHVHVFLTDNTGCHLLATGGNGEAGRQLVAERVRLCVGQEGLCGWTAMTGQTALVNEVRTDPRYLRHPLLSNTQAELVVPMKLRGSVLGVINVESDRLGAFDETDCFTMETLADHVAIAIDNARLFGALQERARQLAAAYDELKALDRMKDEFVQTVSHELRTPLTFIKGYIELLVEGALGALRPEQSEALMIVMQRTENIIHLVNDIISLTRSESVELNAQPHDLTVIARASIQSAQAVTGQAGIHLETDFAPNLPKARGDAQRLTQIFDNLLGNAIKFSPDGGTICVGLRHEGNMIRVEVRDQGIGIAEDRLDRVWERFYQVDSTTTRRFSGTGLGLAIVKRLVEAHSGQVGVESVEGRGSTFFFTIPTVGG